MSASPVIVSPTEGETYAIGPFRIVARVLGGQTNGTFELYGLTLNAGATIDYHVHNKMDETLCVVDGTVEFIVEGKKFLRPAGSVAFIPRGLHHGFTNAGQGPAKVLIFFSPSGSQHEYFRALEKLFAAPALDTAAVQALQKKYDQELVPLGN